MFLTRSFVFSFNTELTGTLVGHVLDRVADDIPVTAYLEDRGHAKISAVARALKKHPQLASHAVAGETRTLVVPLDHAAARAIADGVPKALPFMYSNFAVGPVPALWLRDGHPPPPQPSSHPSARNALGCIVVRSSWWTSRRSLSLEAHLALPLPPRDAARMPPLPEPTRRLIAELGRVHSETQVLVPDDDEERSRASAEPAAAALVAGYPLAAMSCASCSPTPGTGATEIGDLAFTTDGKTLWVSAGPKGAPVGLTAYPVGSTNDRS